MTLIAYSIITAALIALYLNVSKHDRILIACLALMFAGWLFLIHGPIR